LSKPDAGGAHVFILISAAERFAGAFAPKAGAGMFFRNLVIRAFAIPGLAKLAVGRDIADALELLDYSWPRLMN
jgi:hypothetical protein